jgi:hypothetical protein
MDTSEHYMEPTWRGDPIPFHVATEEEILDTDIVKALAKARFWLWEHGRLIELRKERRERDRQHTALCETSAGSEDRTALREGGR